jgi:hypothetical protein
MRGLDSVNIYMARHAVDATVFDPVGKSNLTDVRRALSVPDAGPAIGEAHEHTRFAASCTCATLGVRMDT